ncbi:MAG TPA: hypothetical protein VGN72_19755 [Tepidisphaeraceae bacterium]|jgi:hypothetical protein|nr:hypothetical protein [Tepidisphaeraceae bacterium]
MAGTVKLIVDADTSKGVSEFAKMTAEERKAALEFAKLTRDARAAELQMEKLAAAGTRAGRAQVSASQRLVGGIQARTRGDAGMALTQAQRQALRTGQGYTGNDRAVAIARQFQARELRDQRAFQQFITKRNAGWSAVDLDRTAVLGAGGRNGYNTGNLVADIGSDAEHYAELDRKRKARIAQGKANDLDVFGSRMEADRVAKQKFLERRQSVATGALAVGAAVGGMAEAADQKLTAYADKIVQAEDQMAGLYGVGDNPATRRQLRRGAIATSIGAGMSLEDVADLRGRMESAFDEASMPASAKREAESAAIKYRKLGVRDSTSTALGLGALYSTYGDDLGGGGGAMRLLANRLQHSADVGAFDPDQVTPYLAMMGQAYKGAGYRDTDMFASAALASKTGMRAEAFSTGVRNLPLLMMEGKKKGFQQTGDFAADVGQLAKMESPELLDLVGRDVFVVAKMFADNTALLKTYIAAQQQITAQQDTLGAKIGQMMTDRAFNTAETIKSARQVQENAPLIQSELPGMSEAITEFEIRKAGRAATSNPLFSWLDKPAVWMGAAANSLYEATDGHLGYDDTRDRRSGLTHMIAGAIDSGDKLKAGYLTLMGGEDTGSYFTRSDGKRQYTSRRDADDWIEMRTKGGYDDLSANEYTQYRQMQAAGNGGEAKAFLEQVGKSLSAAADKLSAVADRMNGEDRDRAAWTDGTNNHGESSGGDF